MCYIALENNGNKAGDSLMNWQRSWRRDQIVPIQLHSSIEPVPCAPYCIRFRVSLYGHPGHLMQFDRVKQMFSATETQPLRFRSGTGQCLPLWTSPSNFMQVQRRITFLLSTGVSTTHWKCGKSQQIARWKPTTSEDRTDQTLVHGSAKRGSSI